MLHQIFNDFMNRNSFNRNVSFSQTNKFSQVISFRVEVVSIPLQATSVLSKLKSVGRERRISWIKGETGALPGHIRISACL